METVSKKMEFNGTQLSDIALRATEIHAIEIENEILTPAVPSTPVTKEMYISAPIVDSTNNPTDVQQASSTNNSDTVMNQKSGDYFPINLTLPSNTTAPATTTGSAPLTEDEKRKRAIMIASIILLLLIVLVAIVSRKKAGK